jgi:hypothetical protein
MLWLVFALFLLATAVAFGLSVLGATEQPKPRPAFDEIARLERGDPDPDLAALYRGRHQT